MMDAEGLYWVLAMAAIVLPIRWFVSAYNRRVGEIEKLREDVEQLKEELEGDY